MPNPPSLMTLPPTLARSLRALALPPRAPVLAAVSGGPDSVALALLLLRAGHPVTVAHLHHGIRPDADADLAFVRDFAAARALPFHAERLSVPSLARPRESLEMAARRIRLDFLARTALRLSIPFVATGHNADDQAETLLLRIARGTSVSGLAGIAPSRPDPRGFSWIRPLLRVSRAQIEAFLAAENQPFRTDETNALPFALRNRVRHSILPQIRALLNPRASDALSRLADIARADDSLLSALAAAALRDPLRVRRALALALGTDPSALGTDPIPPIPSIALGTDPKKLPPLPPALARRTAILRLRSSGAPESFAAAASLPPPPPPMPPVPLWPLAEAPFPSAQTTGYTTSPREVSLSLPALAALPHPPAFRPWRPGDRIRPFPDPSKSRLLSDVFTDLKIPRPLRPAFAVLAAGPVVLALPGYRVSAPFRVPTPSSPSLRFTRP